MNKKINNKHFIIFIMITLFNLSFSGCYSSREVSINDEDNLKISKILLNDGIEIDFTKDIPGYATLSNDEIVRFKSNGELEIFPMSTVDIIYTKKFDTLKTVGLIIGIPTVMFIILFIEFAIRMDGRSVGG